MSKMFGRRLVKKSSEGRVPGQPPNGMKEPAEGKVKGGPSSYEGKEHMKYKNPGFTSHKIRYPEDEPHMKSRVSKEEMHEMEDNYHMDTPDQTENTLASKIKRARMNMDAPDQEDPKPLLGNLVRNVGAKGLEDEDGEEDEGPNMMQGSGSKESRKKMIVAVTRRKMKKNSK